MEWWLWIVLGVGLLIGEMMVVGIFLLFFGFGAILVGILTAIGISGPSSIQWLLFSALSIGLLLALRPRFVRGVRGGQPSSQSNDFDDVVGKQAMIVEEMSPGGDGKVEFRGTSWAASNLGKAALKKGQACIVQSVDGLKLGVVAKE